MKRPGSIIVGGEDGHPSKARARGSKFQRDVLAPMNNVQTLDLRYPGGKGAAGLAAWIIDQFPPHVFYLEPFAGKASVYRSKAPALKNWLNDADEDVCTWLRSACPGAIVTCRDGVRLVENAADWATPETLLYIDPPYLSETRVKRNVYRHETSDAEHRRLLDAAHACSCPVFISGYWSPLYATRLEARGWEVQPRWVITRGGVKREEYLWNNLRRLGVDRSTPALTMQYSDLGGNWRERDRVKQKRRRWVEMFEKQTPKERKAILLALLEAHQRKGKRK